MVNARAGSRAHTLTGRTCGGGHASNMRRLEDVAFINTWSNWGGGTSKVVGVLCYTCSLESGRGANGPLPIAACMHAHGR